MIHRQMGAYNIQKSIGSISTALSQALLRDVQSVASMMALEDQQNSQELPTSISGLKDSIATARTKSAESRLALGHEITALHSVYRQILESSIRILEQTIHGSVARGTKAKADYLATVAEGMSKKLELQLGQLVAQLYSEDVQDALRSRSGRLAKETSALKAKVRAAEGKMEEYRRASGMRGMAAEYADIVRETERVREEIERLKSGRS